MPPGLRKSVRELASNDTNSILEEQLVVNKICGEVVGTANFTAPSFVCVACSSLVHAV